MITSKTFKKDLFLLFFLIILNNVFSQNIQKNGIDLLITENPFSLKIIDLKTNKTLLESNGDILIEHIIGSYPYKNKPYIKWKTGKTIAFKNTKNVIHKSKFENWNLYEIGDDDNNPLIRFKYKILELNKIQLEFEEINPILENETQHSRIQINFKSDRLDSFLGMGMRFNKVNHYGTIVTNWCNEVGENLPIVAKKKTEEGQDITYAPIPFFLNLKGYGLLLNSFYYSEFDFKVFHNFCFKK